MRLVTLLRQEVSVLTHDPHNESFLHQPAILLLIQHAGFPPLVYFAFDGDLSPPGRISGLTSVDRPATRTRSDHLPLLPRCAVRTHTAVRFPITLVTASHVRQTIKTGPVRIAM